MRFTLSSDIPRRIRWHAPESFLRIASPDAPRSTGKAFVYDASSGADLAAFQLTPAGQPTFINDVVLTRTTAYFTDSRQPVIYAVARDLSGVTPIELSGFPMTAGNNLNGIEASGNGRVLLAIQSSEGVLWRIDPATGSTSPVDLGGATLANGDGLLLLNDRTLLVVQNRLNQLAVVRLDRDHRSGRIVDTITDRDFDVPTTVASQAGKPVPAERARQHAAHARYRVFGRARGQALIGSLGDQPA